MLAPLPGDVYAIAFSNWRRPVLSACFPDSTVHFVDRISDAPDDGMLVFWGKQAAPAGRSCIRVEDGFLRSVGLGADLVRPLSWVLDSRGIYYDTTQPSDLEHLLQNTVFDTALLARAETLRARIVATGITKYNVGQTLWERPAGKSRVILVPGQVESDASLAYGAPKVHHNMDLLKAVRAACPDAYLVYKPHPDVVAGLRKSGRNEDEAKAWCDEIVIDCPMGKLLDVVDEAHVLTSLAGFEALMRGKKVTAYGQPFYAGWGLTQDIYPIPRRTRRLQLAELIAATLILYPSYISQNTGKLTTPENALDELIAWRDRQPTGKHWYTWFKRMILRRVVGVR